MADHVHYEQYANILTFYVYLTKDQAAINAILQNSRQIYDDYPPCDFNKHVAFVNELYTTNNKPDRLVLPQSSPQDNRDHLKRELDRDNEAQHKSQALEPENYEKIRYNKTLSNSIKINIATKMLQLLGQIIRNSPGSLGGDIKKEVASEAYLLGLRILNAFLSIPENNLDGIRTYVVELVKEHRATRRLPPLLESDLRQVADQGVIYLAQTYAYGFIRKISQSVGLRQLEDTYSEVLAQNSGMLPVRLIDLAIKLDHLETPAVNVIRDMHKELRDNYYAHNTLRDLVYTFLYLRKVNFKTREQLMGWFKIQAGSGIFIDNPSKKNRG
jgi:hypothetical protein